MFGAAIRKQLLMFEMLNDFVGGVAAAHRLTKTKMFLFSEGNYANIWPALELN